MYKATKRVLSRRLSWLSIAAGLLMLSGCDEGGAEMSASQTESSRPVPMLRVEATGQVSSLRFPGRVRSAHRADLAFNVPGQVVELHAEEGQRIEKGQLVARLDDANYRILMESALATYNKARTDHERVARIWETKQMIAKAEVDKQRANMEVARAEYSLARKHFDDTRLLAPFTGVVTRRYVENFSNVEDKAPIIGLQDLNELEIVINVPERIVRNTQKSKTVHAVFADRPEQLLPVHLKTFSAETDSQTQSYEVVLTLEPGHGLTILPGMSVDVVPGELVDQTAAGEIRIPLQAVYSPGRDATAVWLVDPESSRVQLREVKLGEVLGAEVVVRSGLADGETIVTAGVSQLREDMLVRPMTGNSSATGKANGL